MNSPLSDFGASPRGLGRCALETFAALSALIVLDHVVFHGGFAALNPHPFWVVVLLAAMQYGAFGGALAAAAASIALYRTGLPPRGAEDFFQYAAAITTLPALWILAATMFGGLRTLHLRKTSALEASLNETLNHAKTIAAGFSRACDEIRRLEIRIASDTATADTIIRDIADIGAASAETEHARLARFAHHCLGTSVTTIWLFSSSAGDDEITAPPPGIDLPHDVIKTLVNRTQAVALAGLPDDIAVAAPIVQHDEVCGLLILWRVEDMSSGEAVRLGRRAELVGQALGALLKPAAHPSAAIPFRTDFKRLSSAS